MKLIPHWRNLMQVEQIEAEQVQVIFHQAIAQMLTPWGVSWALMLALALIFIGCASLCSRQICWWAFGGAVLSTILVDGLFWLTAALA